MRQAVSATLSVWGERRLGYSTLNDSREVLLDEGWLMPGLKEDSVVEEKEVADGEQEQPEAAVARSPSTPQDVRCLTQTKGDGAQPEAATPSSPQTSESPSARSVYSTNGPAPEGRASDKRRGSLGAPPVQCCSLGSTAPQWVPDSHAPACMKCGSRFSFTRRRHHCRACGKVFCVVCCDLRFRLSHLGGKEGRVCVTCHSTLINRTIRKEQKKVWFADSVLPRNEVSSANTTPTHGDSTQTHTPTASQVESPHLPEKLNSPCLEREEVVNSPKQNAAKLLPHKGLPPILTSTGVKGDYTVEERRTESSLLEELEQGLTEPLVFVLNANLLAMVKIVSYVNRRCWCVMSRGMHAVGQPEVVVLLQCLPEEKSFPTDIFSHFIQIYWDAQTAGKLLNHLSHSSAARGFLGGSEHAGFLYVRPTFQSLDGLPLPPQPFLFGLLVLRAELPWARAFPLRLLLRLGAEYRFYPCPLFSVRFREPLFGPVRNSIMRLLVDFRFYRYTLPVVTGLMVDLEARSTCITIPKTRHTELLKALNRSIEKVLAMAACFNERADSHLICVQTADGEYQTQAISIHSQPRRVTGSCFFVFSGSLKPSSGYLAKSSIVEDGLMVQVTMETMLELRRALRDMRDFTLTCGKLHQSDRQEYVHIQWQDEEPCFNKGIISPIDGKSMESITCVKTCQRLEYRANGKVIRWTEVFFLQREKQSNGLSRDANQKRVTERLARAFCLTLCQSLSLLKEDGMSKLGLRITLDGLKTEFLAGSNGQRLPEPYQASVKQALTAVVQSTSQHYEHTSLQLELIFYILEDIS